jgi:hypothetical protein
LINETLAERIERNFREFDEIMGYDESIDDARVIQPAMDTVALDDNKAVTTKVKVNERLGDYLSKDSAENLRMHNQEKATIGEYSEEALIGVLMLHKEELTKLAEVKVDQRRNAAMFLFARPRNEFKPIVGSAWHICQSLGIDPMSFQLELLTEMFNSPNERIFRWAKIIFFFMQTNPEMLYDTHDDGRVYEEDEFSNLLFDMYGSREAFMQEVDLFIASSRSRIMLKVTNIDDLDIDDDFGDLDY